MLLFLLLVVGGLGRRRPLAGAGRGDRRLPARQLVLRPAALHVHDRGRREHPRARRLPRRRGRSSAASSRSPRGEPQRARRARAEAEALLRLAGSSPASAVLECLCRVLGLEGAAVLHRQEGGWRIEAASGDRVPESPEASSMTIELDDEHVLALAGAPIRSEDQRVLDAFAKELAASVELGELEAEAGDAPRRSRRRTSCAPRSSPPFPTTCARRSPRSRRRSRACSSRTSTGRPRRSASSCETIDEETDRLNALVGNLLDMSRLQSGRARDQRDAGRARGGAPGGPSQPRRRRRLGRARRLGVPPARLADPGLLERALANVIENAVRFSPPGIARTGDRRSRRRRRRRARRRPRAGRVRRGARAALRARSSGSATRRRARASGSAWPWRRDSSRRWAARSRSRTRPGGGLTVVAAPAGGGMSRDPRRRRRAADPPRARHQPEGARATTSTSRRPARRHSTLAASKHPDLVILDLGLPGIDGVEVIRGPARLDARPDHRPLRARDRARQGRRARRRRGRLRHEAVRDGRAAGSAPGRAAASRARRGGGGRRDGGLHRRPRGQAGDRDRRRSAADADRMAHRRGARPQPGQARHASASCSRRSGARSTRRRRTTCASTSPRSARSSSPTPRARATSSRRHGWGTLRFMPTR